MRAFSENSLYVVRISDFFRKKPQAKIYARIYALPYKSATLTEKIQYNYVPVVELDTIKASDANTRYYDFAEYPLYVVVFVVIFV